MGWEYVSMWTGREGERAWKRNAIFVEVAYPLCVLLYRSKGKRFEKKATWRETQTERESDSDTKMKLNNMYQNCECISVDS